ncbi:MAG: hypothetical protein ABIB71_03660 [Candidatus Woesearchaeota archaeon]
MATISLNKTVDDIFSGYSKLEAPEERKEHKVEGSLFFEGFEELVKKYERILAISTYYVSGVLDEIDSILQPEQIDSFLQSTIRYDEHKNYSENTGLFITRLIQNSHNAGNNRFMLNTKALSKDINYIGGELKGREKNLLEIIVGGDCGEACGIWAKNIRKIRIARNAGKKCGFGANNLKELYIGGNAGEFCGSGALNIRQIYIGGKAQSICGDTARNSTFKTPNEETLRLLKKNVPKGQGNKIYFIHPDNHEEEIKEW